MITMLQMMMSAHLVLTCVPRLVAIHKALILATVVLGTHLMLMDVLVMVSDVLNIMAIKKLWFLSTDINECAMTGASACEQNCQNTNGTYTCGCNTGYTLNRNGFSCTSTRI